MTPGTLLDVVVLVFSRSELKDLVGTDALKMVLGSPDQMRALMPSPGTMSLQPVWDLLEGQPGFDPRQAIAPVCRIKTWEGRLKVKVELPRALSELDSVTRERMALRCNVGDDDLEKLLRPRASPTQPPAVRVIEVTSGAAVDRRSNRKLQLAIGAAVLAVAAAGVSLWLTYGGDDGVAATERLSAGELAPGLPIANVRKSGQLIVATLVDASWLARPEAERRTQLEAAAGKAMALGAKGFSLYDARGKLVAAVVTRGGKQQITFPK